MWLEQVVNPKGPFGSGVPITYTLDLAAPLVTVLVEEQLNNQTTYLYGLGDSPLAGYDGSGWTYLAGRDALNSVRQETDASGQVLAARSFDPYGVPLSGDGGEPFGYTGEMWNRYTELQWLRARWYSPAIGRLLSKDPWEGNPKKPISLSPWLYVYDNPVGFVDASGKAPFDLAMCLALVLSDDYATIQYQLGLRDTTVGEIINGCKAAYRPDAGWQAILKCTERARSDFPNPQTVEDLFASYICETGPDVMRFTSSDPLTQELAKSWFLDQIRRQYYSVGDIDPGKHSQRDFGFAEFAAATAGSLTRSTGPGIHITHFLGSFEYGVTTLPTGRVGFTIDNKTELASGTHFPLRKRSEYPNSLEDLVDANPQLANEPLGKLLDARYGVISVLRPKSRAETKGSGGGTIQQVFQWSERRLACDQIGMPFPQYLPLLDIGP